MSTKKKLIIAISAVSVTLVATLITLIVVLVASSQLASSNVVVEYVATDVSAIVSATYRVGDTTTVLTNNGTTKLEFKPGKNNKGSLTATGDIELTPANPTIVFEYVFTNTATNSDINVELVTTTSVATNAKISYAYSSYQITNYDSLTTFSTYTTQGLLANASADSTLYVYIVVTALDANADARCVGNFAWNLVRA